jgi:hypothetical protein
MVCDINSCISVPLQQQRFCPQVSKHEWPRQMQVWGLASASGFGFGFGKARVPVANKATAAMSVVYFILI